MLVIVGQVWINKKTRRKVVVTNVVVVLNVLDKVDDRMSKVHYENLGEPDPGKRYMRKYGRRYLDTFLRDFRLVA